MDKLDKSLSDIIGAGKKGRNGKVSKGRKKYRSAPYSKSSAGGGNKACRVYVGNLLYETQWQELKDHMRQAGDVVKADIIKQGNRPSGSAIVTFKTAADAKNAIDTLHDSELEGRQIFVREDREAAYQGGNGRRANGSGFGGGKGNFNEPVFSPHSNLSQKIRANAGAGCVVFIGNLPWAAKWQEVKDLCTPFGSVERADVEENEDGRSKGFGIAVFSDSQAANDCIQGLNGTEFEGRVLEVKLDKFGGGGGGGGFRGNFQGNNNSFQQGFLTAQRMMMGQFGGQTVNFGGAGNTRNFGGGGGGAGVKVFVGNLPWSAQWQELKDMGKEYGDVVRADIKENAEGRSAGYGFLTFRNAAAAKACIAGLHGQIFEGRDLTVHFDKKS